MWKPIESAPRDGRHIQVCCAVRQEQPPFTVHWFDGGFHLSVNALGEYSDHGCSDITHWRLLPRLPKPGLGKGKGWSKGIVLVKYKVGGMSREEKMNRSAGQLKRWADYRLKNRMPK